MKSSYYDLFELMGREHGLYLLESELQEIIYMAQQVGWVSIDDYLPDNKKMVLGLTVKGDIVAAFNENNDWYRDNGEWLSGITHWMEQPFPPSNQ